LSVTALSRAFAEGALDPLAALEALSARIEARNPSLNAFLTLRLDEACAEARESRRRWRDGVARSALDGVPFAVKANIAVAGLPLHAGIAAYRDNIADEDAPVVARLRVAGAIPMGVVNMHEGALGATTDNPHFGRCHNPWKEGLTPGGSSGGSAAAVAAGLAPFALGTDTMGSVRIPSAYCGVAGIKPTRGLLPEGGLLDLSPTLDHVGVHAGDAADLALVMRTLGMTEDDLDARAAPRIAVAEWGEAVAVAPEIRQGFLAATESLQRAKLCGPRVDFSALEFGAARRSGLLVSEVEGCRTHRELIARRRSGFSEAFLHLLEWGARQPGEKIEAAYRAVRETGARFAEEVERAGVLMLPTAPQGPFPFSAPVPVNQADFTCLANFAGLPAVAVPATVDGAPPASVQFIAPRGRDALALSAAVAFERARGTPGRAPV
jgi:aspartyl-tRNA(Asn)/glutamyl-tRNA(Gln) amidotransferase subunit A